MQRSIGARAGMHATRRGPRDSAGNLGSWLPWSQESPRENGAGSRSTGRYVADVKPIAVVRCFLRRFWILFARSLEWTISRGGAWDSNFTSVLSSTCVGNSPPRSTMRLREKSSGLLDLTVRILHLLAPMQSSKQSAVRQVVAFVWFAG